MEQLVILVLIGLISLINWIVQKSAQAREKRKLANDSGPEKSFAAPELHSEVQETREPEPVSERSASGADDAMKNLMDALGLETQAVPEPEEVTPPRMPTSLEQMVADMEANTPVFDEELPRKITPRAPKPRAMKPIRSNTRVGELLAAPGGLRNGIILAEILGPPKGLQ